MADEEIMGRNEYARHQGVSPAAVLKAARTGRISKAVVWGSGGRIEGIRWRQADELWAGNTDPDQALRTRRTLGPRQAREPTHSFTDRELGDLITQVYLDSVMALGSMLVGRYRLRADVALEASSDTLLIILYALAEQLNIDEDQRWLPVDRMEFAPGARERAIAAITDGARDFPARSR